MTVYPLSRANNFLSVAGAVVSVTVVVVSGLVIAFFLCGGLQL